MSAQIILLIVTCLVGLSGLIPGEVKAQAGTQYAQFGPFPPVGPYPDDRERWREERRREEQYRREERKRLREQERRERAYQNWYNEEWRRHNQRYFGGNAMIPFAGESYEAYVRRVQAQCNVRWDRCARYCNTIRDAYRRAACVANCNNELHECNSWR